MDKCPLEQQVADALAKAAITFTRQTHEQALDFHLPVQGVYIEVKAWHSERISRQMATQRNVIVLQGPSAVALFCSMLEKARAISQ